MYIAKLGNTAMLALRRTGKKLGTGYKIRKNFSKTFHFLKATYKISVGCRLASALEIMKS